MRIEDYLQAPYHFRLQHLDDGDGPYWFATVEELPGCMSDGETEAEAMDNVRDAMAGWIMAAIEEGRAVPAPSAEPEYSGQFRVRLPAELHAALARGADRQGTSLNQLVVGLLAGGIGWGAGVAGSAGLGAPSYAAEPRLRALAEDQVPYGE